MRTRITMHTVSKVQALSPRRNRIKAAFAYPNAQQYRQDWLNRKDSNKIERKAHGNHGVKGGQQNLGKMHVPFRWLRLRGSSRMKISMMSSLGNSGWRAILSQILPH